MALDGAFLHKLRNEIEYKALGCRVDKIYQPSRDELVFSMRSKEFNSKMLICANGSAPRVHFTEYAPENPATPPMFCMLLRKMLVGAKLSQVLQHGIDRVLTLVFDTRNELGDRISVRLVTEILGGRSNIILIGDDGKIIDAVRRTDLETTCARIIQPGATYTYPEKQDKINLLDHDVSDITERLKSYADNSISSALQKIIDGASPLICREISFLSCRDIDKITQDLSEDDITRLKLHLERLKGEIKDGGTPTILKDSLGTPFEFSYTSITQYGMAARETQFNNYSAVLDSFYAAKEHAASMRRLSSDYLKVITTLHSRALRKLEARRRELASCADREKSRIFGELIKANLHNIPKGAAECIVQNYYDPELSNIKIPLNNSISAAQNAQKHFKDYKKSYVAEQMLTKLIEEGENELVYLDSLFDTLSRIENTTDFAEIRCELEDGGYVRKSAAAARKKAVTGKPMEFVSSDGIKILVGRNNTQNDLLTLKTANRDNTWLHTKNIPGSHVIIEHIGEPPDTTLLEAAQIAAHFSKAANSSSVPVDYTLVRRVKKPAGAKPGMVIYDTNKSLFVTPNKIKIEELRV